MSAVAILPAVLSETYVDELRVVGVAAGLDRLGVTGAEPFTETRSILDERKAAGLHGGMQFTYRNPERSTDPARAMPGVQSLVVGAHAYAGDASRPDEPEGEEGPFARVARYARADHYGVLRGGLDAVAGRLRADGYRALVLLDDNALVDRAAAARAGLGWYGKNANLLLDGSGSWFVLGSVLTDAPLPPARGLVVDGCGACTRCIDGCPTGAIIEPGVVDARRCLAWLVQAEGMFPKQFRVALGDRLYGCDDCQEVCPPSIRSAREPSGAARTSMSGAGSGTTGAWVAVLDVLAATDEELLQRFGRWYIPRREPRYLRRNALIVLGNAASIPIDARVEDALVSALASADVVVRAHAIWAARRLGADHLLVAIRSAVAVRGHEGDDGRNGDRGHDGDDIVRAELAAHVVSRAGSS